MLGCFVWKDLFVVELRMRDGILLDFVCFFLYLCSGNSYLGNSSIFLVSLTLRIIIAKTFE